MNNKKKKFAVFDIDGTLFRSSLLIELVEGLIDEGLFPKHSRKFFEEEYHLWLDRRGTYKDYIDKVVLAYIENIPGLYLGDVMEVADSVFLFHKNRVYRFTRDLIEKVKDTHFLMAISHSPYHIVEHFARKWGFQKVYAFYYELDERKRLTGVVEHEDLMRQKDKILERAIEKENLTLAGSIGVGDSESDAAFLKMVESPIAFNPSSELYRIAKRKGWKIVVERKDVIYTIK